MEKFKVFLDKVGDCNYNRRELCKLEGGEKIDNC